jgi:tartrate dehydratase beta subunit/fumarate hydratase class I family protein
MHHNTTARAVCHPKKGTFFCAVGSAAILLGQNVDKTTFMVYNPLVDKTTFAKKEI